MKRLAVSAATAVVVGGITQSMIFTACSALAAMALLAELQHRKNAKRHELVKRNWAEVLDSLA
ncbi:MAG: hypothetical protein RLZZ359_593, partial [Actinomycetota bacterium]